MDADKKFTNSGIENLFNAGHCNKEYHRLIENGLVELNLNVDLPTQAGHDSDHVMAEGKVGKGGVAIDSLKDMETLFNGIQLEAISISMIAGAAGFILLAFYVALAKRQGADLKQLSGTLQDDTPEEYATKGTYIYPVKHSRRIITDVREWSCVELPRWNISSVSGGHIGSYFREAPGIMADNSVWQEQTDQLNLLKRQRNPAKCDSVLQGLNDCAASDENIMPAVLESAENYCTLGEIADTLREVYGEYR